MLKHRGGGKRSSLAGLAALLCCLSLAIAACGSNEPASEASSPAPSDTSGGNTLTVVGGSQIPDPIEAYLYVAQSQGYFADEGVDVRFTIAASGTVGISQTVAGRADVFYGGMDPLPAANGDGAHLVAFYNQFYSPLWSMAYFKPGLDQVSELKGTRVGVVSTSSASIPLLDAVLNNAGLSESDIKMVPIGQASTSLAAIKAKRVDAAVWTTPWGAYLKQAGIKYVSQEMPGFGGQYPGFGMAATQETITQKKDVLTKFTRAFAKGQEYCLADVQRCATIYKEQAKDSENPTELIADQIKIGGEMAKLPAKANGVHGWSQAAYWDAMVKAQLAAGVIDGNPSPDSMFTNEIVDAAAKGS